MAFLARFRIASDKEKTVAAAKLVKASTGDFDFYLFTILGVSMATLGLVLNSPEIIIGSMLIAPILYPLLSLSLGLTLYDIMISLRSVRTLFVSTGASVLIAFMVTTILNPTLVDFSSQILARAEPSVLYFIVAFISGFAASYALVHANINETLPGVAISVALLPPLAVVGIGVAALEWHIAVNALLLFLLNVSGIIVASMLAFSLMDLHATRRIADSAIRQEDRRLEKEQQKLEQLEHADTGKTHLSI
jgi:uncharacterized hydrophobic protein (TIGR00271 family)